MKGNIRHFNKRQTNGNCAHRTLRQLRLAQTLHKSMQPFGSGSIAANKKSSWTSKRRESIQKPIACLLCWSAFCCTHCAWAMCIICGQCVAAEIMPECATHDVANVTSEENGTQLNLSRQAVPLELGTIDPDSMEEKTLKSFACIYCVAIQHLLISVKC